MLLSLADLSLRSGESYERIYLLEFEPVSLGGEEYRVLLPDGVHLKVDRVAGGYLVTIDLEATLYGPCNRCLHEAVIPVHAEQQEFAPTAKDGWQETDESDFIDALVVDVDGLAREAFILALPAQVVCDEDCKGLCAYCGTDLNKDVCSCTGKQPDDRWGALKHLRLEEGAGGSPGGESEGAGETPAT